MENQSTINQDCGCSDGCCTPKKKSNPWKKWIFIAIILAAVSIVTIKLVAKQGTQSEKCCPAETSTCCPQPKVEE